MSSIHKGGASDVASRLAFFKGLQTVTNRIHATENIDEIMFELSADICSLFAADRLTIYVVDESKTTISSRVKTGLHSIRTIRLPIAENSVAGYVALTGQMLNIHDAYDEQELKAISMRMEFRKEVDERTGYRCHQMLVAPISSAETGDVLGVIQLINSRSGEAFSAIAEEGIQGLGQTLAVAFAQRRHALVQPKSKYEGLVNDGKLTGAELEAATSIAREQGVSLEHLLLEQYKLKPADIGSAISRFFGVPYEPFRSDRVKPLDLLRNLKRDYVQQAQWLPLEENPDGLLTLVTDPEQAIASRVVQNVFPKAAPVFCVTTQVEFMQTVAQFFGGSASDDASVSDLLSDMQDDDGEGAPVAEDVSAAADNELVKLVNRIIIDAHRQGASDIHIEPRPGKEKTQIRFRRDGSLVPYIEVPSSYRSPIVTRIKIMCDLDISERRKPQDGKIKFRRFGPLDIELRVATVPTTGGMEDVVMRLLANSEPIPLEKLGLLESNYDRLRQTVAKPYGIFFVCGPTGSGKTTTLHSILGHINTPETKIWTAEDPVEITQKGLRQVQVNRKAGLDFPTVMRSFLRADPDVIMVGEMRDKETVSIGLEASLTGHLVFSTLHTNSAPESIVRLLDMGMDPFNFADALLGILAQRLAKRLCSKCKKPYHPSDDEVRGMLDEYCEDLRQTPAFMDDPVAAKEQILARWRQSYADDKGRFTLYEPVGCDQCNGGYKGRLGLHELMVGSDRIKSLIQERARVSALLSAALDEGMRTLRQDGIEKVFGGVTDLKQVRKVCIR
ncbi:ATPase, T2SS/T4P/T4SS family [Zoogloea sp.]|mgnify:FL=1|jgi:type II secretory ATPase GspE/PulE/Tfp pilus assembly ATPase PilB-like protein|uniref:GspE/PulE family protein n=1 Tax=Zoogloea sp. TaxID=49181 RepID=UPI0011D73D50|nr:ATPase, T2SS/T4P/T4SS family [Zoogloea sp.]MBK6654404.1 Flp pilus assembly complex ATPase component TadA [Zoogloea sp.]MBP7443806.1 Flp pilus assembly complex ATPase component TadA [Zoogloea sp.]TXG98241.1 MAG: GAF domain-containing protein [Zoogloea sp.]HOY01115.1 ATPase, T2SS/T4P/T4SS family [Zoogloea sp.]HPI59954.1 ATPase, T2SS/T4P/T4SS family [Zoogloea sp.]